MPDATALLAGVQAEERRQNEGRLRIFLGYCAGVGKTYAMLEAAGRLQAEGVDVVVGWVDTHGRQETEAMIAGLEVLPRRRVRYRDCDLAELDLDRILERRPDLVLVDELAHTNVPGSRHRKRWQDVEEILKAGIDVWTTLNIQHLESLNDVVSQITRVRVRETLPDRILDEAEEIKLIDVPPEELLQRLKEGKVYIPAQARQAAENFFGPGKLAALRELVMRRAAERLDNEMRAHTQLMSIAGPWPAAESLLVLVGPSPFSERLIRATKRLATQLRASWQALYVDTDASVELTDEERDRLEHNLALAESLGAYTVRLSGEDVVATALEFARARNMTKIVCGRPVRRGLFKTPLCDLLIRDSGEIQVLVVTADRSDRTEIEPRLAPPEPSLAGYALAVGLVALVTILGRLSSDFLATPNLVMFYLLATVLTALRTGRGPAVACAALGVICLDFFFVPPRYTFVVSDTQYLLTFAALLAVGLVIGTLTSRVREQMRSSRRSQLQVMAAFALSRDLAQSASVDSIVQDLVKHLDGPLSAPVTVFLPQGEQLTVHPGSAHRVASSDDLAVAGWVHKNGRMAGCGTDTLPAVKDLYFPLRCGEETLGVLRLKLDGHRLHSSQRLLLETLANLTAMAFERVSLTEEARRAEILEETERLQSTLLNSISHDLQTPITSIMGSLDGLADPAVRDEQTLVQSAREQADRLKGLVANLLDMTRVESHQLGVKKEPCALDELLGSALGRLEEAYRERPMEVSIPADLPLLPVDEVLFGQVLYNLLDNTAKYTPAGSSVEIEARVIDRVSRRVQIRLSDHGRGIPPEARERIFDKFYRLPGPVAGTGLGLAICRGLVELHGGSLWVEEREGGGSTFVIQLPV